MKIYNMNIHHAENHFRNSTSSPFVPRPDRRFHRSTTGTPASDTSRPASGEGGWLNRGTPVDTPFTPKEIEQFGTAFVK